MGSTMERIRWIETDETTGLEIEYSIPAIECTCSVCNGVGTFCMNLVNKDDRKWSKEELADFENGGYDVDCPECGGGGKVLEPANPDGPLALRYKKEDERRRAIIEEDSQWWKQ